MKWISLKELQRDFGLSPAVAEKVVREQVIAVGKEGWRSWILAACFAVGSFWNLVVVRWLVPFPHHNWHVAIAALPGMLFMAARWFFLPRLLAADAILASANALAEGAHLRLEPDSAGQI